MKNNPLIDVAAILLCLLAVIAIGHYMKTKKEQENSLKSVEKRVELKVNKNQTFESLSKRTE